jgi:transcriptional regulator with GAF, ATPase, and Fis domain
MKEGSFEYIADPRLASAGAEALAHAARIAATQATSDFPSVIDPLAQQCLRQTLHSVRADEGAIWLADAEREHLTAAFTTQRPPNPLLGFQQPVSEGLISMVYATEQPLCVGRVNQDCRHSKKVDETLGQSTESMIAVPLEFGGEVRGVISCVRFTRPPGEPDPDFSAEDLTAMQAVALVIQRLANLALLECVLELES